MTWYDVWDFEAREGGKRMGWVEQLWLMVVGAGNEHVGFIVLFCGLLYIFSILLNEKVSPLPRFSMSLALLMELWGRGSVSIIFTWNIFPIEILTCRRVCF